MTEPAKWISKWKGYGTQKRFGRPSWMADKKNLRILGALKILKQ